MKNIAVAPRVKVSADGHGVVSHAGMGMLRELADRTGLSAQVTAALADTYRGRGCTHPARCSPIWRPRSPTGRTASTASASCAVTASTPSRRRPPRPRCGGWSTRASTPRTCRRYGRRERPRGQRPGRPERARPCTGGCPSMSMRPWSSITPTTSRARRRPGRRRWGTTRCWRTWTAPRSPAGKPWPGCYATATPAPTPPPTTSSCWLGPWHRCRLDGGPTPTTPQTRTSRGC